MKVLTLHQPWATLVAIGAKQIETRGWSTAYRGPLAIHASRNFPPEASTLCWQSPMFEALVAAGLARHVPNALPHLSRTVKIDMFPLGSILCVCDLVDMVRITADNAPPEPERSFGNYTPGRYAWHLANVQKLAESVPYRGHQGLRDLTPQGAQLLAFTKGIPIG